MIKTAQRYVFILYLRNFLFSSLGLLAIFIFQSFFGEMLNSSHRFIDLVIHHLYQSPQVFAQLAPPAALVATVLTLSSLNRSNELTALYSIGIGLKKISLLLLLATLGICFFLLILQDSVLPVFFRKTNLFYWKVMKGKQDYTLDIKKNKIWYKSSDTIYNINAFDSQNSKLYGVNVYRFNPSFKLIQTVHAETALYNQKTEGWELNKGLQHDFIETDPFPIVSPFQKIGLSIEEKPKDFKQIEKQVDGLRTLELYRYIQQTRKTGMDTKAFEVKLHSRFSMSFLPLMMCLLGIPFSTRNKREGGMGKDLGISLGFTFLYWIFYSIGLSLGTKGSFSAVVAAWGPTFVFALLTGIFLVKKNK